MTRIWAFIALATIARAFDFPVLSAVQAELQPQLSLSSSIGDGTSAPQRWSAFGAPQAKIIINVTSEQDVATAVQFCNQQNLTFVAQNGGNGWADTFDLGDNGVIINLAGLNQIVFSEDKSQATVQGGVTVRQAIDAAYTNNTRFANPNCLCLGFLGTALGGGLTRMSGLYGWAVDSIESFNIVLASGEMVQVSNDTNPDLFWAVRGAGANFGIVTSAVLKTYPTPMEQNIAWQGPVTYSEDKLNDLVVAIDSLILTPEMEVDLLLATDGPPNFTPGITLWPFYVGNASAAEEAFAPLLALGPTVNNATEMPYSEWSDWSGPFCERGGRKPAYGASGTRIDPASFVEAWEEFKAFIAEYGADVGTSSILVEHYGTGKGIEIGNATSSYPYRELSYHTVTIPWYYNESFDSTADAWGKKIRGLLRTDDGVDDNSTYINFAHGDESQEEIYGSNLPRLQELKAQYDPQNRFGQWFPLA